MRETALVLGAGASKAFNLPLGSELRDQIARDLDIKFNNWARDLSSGSYEIVEALRVLTRSQDGRTGDINPHRAAAVEIAEAMPLSSSIDEYIERHRGNEMKAICAKLAIAKLIIEAERKSSIFIESNVERNRPLSRASESWLAHFLRDVTRGVSADKLSEAFSNLTVVNFNYDRCFQHFTYNWLQDVYRLPETDAASIVRDIVVYHPYGRIAPLGWEDPSAGVGFGRGIETHKLVKMAQQIRTYSEVFEPDSGLFQIRDRLRNIDAVLFLGFGFHKQNMEILSVEGGIRERNLNCFSTRSGISQPKWEIMKKRICKSFSLSSPLLLNDFSMNEHCEKFWQEYSDVILSDD